MSRLALLPQPRSINFKDGRHFIEPNRLIVLQAPESSRLLFSSQHLQAALQKYAGRNWAIWAGLSGPAEQVGVVLCQSPDLELPAQGYELEITPGRIEISARTPAAIFYAVSTLIQIVRQTGAVLPCLKISDWPDFPVRGYMLDVSRDKVPTPATLLGLVDKLAEWKINQLQLYTEHTFAYRNHPQVWENASPLTGQDILELDAYCKERFIELVPNQNSFGHMHRWLIHPRYADLGEVTEGFFTPWGYRKGPFSLDPTNPGSLELVTGLYDELLPHFSSRLFNVGCDETFDLGQGRSKPVCDELGRGRVYLDFLLKIYNHVMARGYTMQFWGDIILQHPELIPRIPKDVIALDWGYEDEHPFEQECARFEEVGIPFYVCPGTSAWCSLAGRTQNAIDNLRHAAEAGLKHGASGYLITDWGDLGHWQVLPVSYLGIAVGAAYAWDLAANRDLNVPAAISWHAFEDETGVMGPLAYDLGNVYRLPGMARHNSSQLFWFLEYSAEQLKKVQGNPAPGLEATPAQQGYVSGSTLLDALGEIERIMAPLEESQMAIPDAALVKREFRLTARLMRLACLRGLRGLESYYGEVIGQSEIRADLPTIIEEYRQVWLSRNRPGGLEDSVAGLLNLSEEDLVPVPVQ